MSTLQEDMENLREALRELGQALMKPWRDLIKRLR